MTTRRSLTEGLKPLSTPADAEREKQFVYGESRKPIVEPPITTLASQPSSSKAHVRVPLSTKLRADYSEALKRASLERQLARVEPNTLQDILEEAVAPWLRSNGYLG